MEADIQPARCSPRCGPHPERGLPRGRGTFCYFHKVPYRLGWPDSRGEVSRERDFICRGESAEAGWCQWGGLDLHSDQEGLKLEHSLGPRLGGNDVNGKAEHWATSWTL